MKRKVEFRLGVAVAILIIAVVIAAGVNVGTYDFNIPAAAHTCGEACEVPDISTNTSGV